MGPEAVGHRTQTYIDDLLQNPDRCSPDHSERSALLRNYADKLNPHQAYAMRNLLGKNTSRGERISADAMEFNFPEDDASQNTFQAGGTFSWAAHTLNWPRNSADK